MSAKAFFTGFRVNEDPKFSEGQRSVSFSICSANAYYNGQKLKVYISAFDEAAEMVKRLKVKKGSFIDAIAEMVPYSRKEQFGIGYKLLTISFSEFQMDSKDKEVPEKKTKEDALREAAEILATNPFA